MDTVFKFIFAFFAGFSTRGVGSDHAEKRNMTGLPISASIAISSKIFLDIQ
jgi:hypothetical protein